MKVLLVLGWGFIAAVILLVVNIVRDIRRHRRAERVAERLEEKERELQRRHVAYGLAARPSMPSTPDPGDWEDSPKRKEVR